MNFFTELCVTFAALFLSYIGFVASLELAKIAASLKSIDRALNFQADITNDVAKILSKRL